MRDTVTRHLAPVPFGHRPTKLLLRVRPYQCSGCGRIWREDTTRAAEPRAKLSRGGLRWALEAVVVDHLAVSRVAAGLGVSWHTANSAVLAEGKRLLIDAPGRFDGVAVIGIDEHVWRHTRRGDKYVTVVIDLTPVGEEAGSSRLRGCRDGRFTGFKTAATEELPDAVTVTDPFRLIAIEGVAG
ncbi:transposase IS204/IS1001/IS1096/IS1165 family protein [Microbacterium laevaniformans OR221]|nr:transposase IS204/IS1001/IS1096/IS1165 family protein [Microbacterium laevaniformans OR221]